MESTSSSSAGGAKLEKADSFEEGGLSLNLKKTNSDSEDENEGEGADIEDDLDLLEY